MTTVLKISWYVWKLSLWVTLAGAIAFHISSWPTSIEVQLLPNSEYEITVIRPLPDVVRLGLNFQRSGWRDKRPELGEYRTGEEWKTTGYFDFQNAGEPVRLIVRNGDREVVYKAEPSGAFSERSILRELRPDDKGHAYSRFTWPENAESYVSISPGVTRLKVVFSEVGSKIAGEKVSLIVQAPISWKFCRVNYLGLWWFMFWPLYLLVLMGLGEILRRLSKRSSC